MAVTPGGGGEGIKALAQAVRMPTAPCWTHGTAGVGPYQCLAEKCTERSVLGDARRRFSSVARLTHVCTLPKNATRSVPKIQCPSRCLALHPRWSSPSRATPACITLPHTVWTGGGGVVLRPLPCATRERQLLCDTALSRNRLCQVHDSEDMMAVHIFRSLPTPPRDAHASAALPA